MLGGASVQGASKQQNSEGMKRDLILVLADLAGLGALAYGCWLAWHPAGFIVPGGLVFGLSVIADWRRGES
jgi:hypothetical protein